MTSIEVRIIPHREQRYDTVGDWWIDDAAGWHVRISDMGNWRYHFLVAFHELLELAWCQHSNVTQGQVDAFDIAYEKARKPGDTSEPGDDPRAPYRVGHQFATAAERLAAAVLGVDWTKYEEAVNALDHGS